MSQLGQALVKLSKALDLGPGKKQPSIKAVDKKFAPISHLDVEKRAMLEELEALGYITSKIAATVSDEQARRAMDRLDQLEQSKPTLHQAARYGAIGAIAGPAISTAGKLLSGNPVISGKGVARTLAGEAMKGALGGGAMPLITNQLDRKSEIGTLRKYVAENQLGEPSA